MDNALDAMLAERAIERLIIDYAAHNDAGDWDAVAAMFLPDGAMNRPSAPDVFITGHSAILAAFQSRPARRSRHIVANIRVTVSGDKATASSQIMLFTSADAAALVGTYQDRLVLTADGWRFAQRAGNLDFST